MPNPSLPAPAVSRVTAPDVAIVGGGLVGLTCAWALDQAGARVVVLDAGTRGAASAASAGMLGPLFEAVDAAPALPGPRAFASACRTARDLWVGHAAALESETGIECDHDTTGARILDEDGLHRLLLEGAAAAGEPARRLGLSAARDALPDLAPDCPADLLLPGEHRVDPRRVLDALDRALALRGVSRLEGHRVERVRPADASTRSGVHLEGRDAAGSSVSLTCGQVVIAGGAWSDSIDGLPKLPVRPVRGQMLQLEGVDWSFRGSLRGRTFYAVPRRGGRLHVGATVEEAGFEAHTTVSGLGALRDWVRRVLPGLTERTVSAAWAGLRPGTPDHLPILGPHPEAPGCLWATGHYRNGVLLTPWTAQRVVEQLSGGQTAGQQTAGKQTAGRQTTGERVDLQTAAALRAFAPNRFQHRASNQPSGPT